jgi:hypothetical protein
MKKILWTGVLMSALLATAFMSVSNSRPSGAPQVEPLRQPSPLLPPRRAVAGQQAAPELG